MTASGVVGDVGGTHARFALVDANGLPGEAVDLPSADSTDLESALRAGCERLGVERVAGLSAAIAVAAPVAGDEVALTNVGWRFSIEATRRALGLRRLVVLNDLEAGALALPRLGERDLETWSAGEPAPDSPRVLLGVGTGLGVGIAIRAGGRWRALASEGGHRDLAAGNEREWRVVRSLAERYDRVSAERALSGRGLVDLYEAVCALDGTPAERLDPARVAAGARAGAPPACVEACRLFSAWLGAVAGDLVLTLGARGGLFLTGGVLAGMGEALDRGLFLARRRAKGRFAGYVERVPVHRVVAADAALHGAAAALAD